MRKEITGEAQDRSFKTTSSLKPRGVIVDKEFLIPPIVQNQEILKTIAELLNSGYSKKY